MQQYLLMGDPRSVDFPTYTQYPACDYAITYSCFYSKWDPQATNNPSLDITDPTLASLKNTVTCDTTNKIITADIKQHIIPAPTDLTNYQY